MTATILVVDDDPDLVDALVFQKYARYGGDLRGDKRRLVVDRIDIEAGRNSKGPYDAIKLLPRDHVFDPGKAVRRSLLGELHRSLRSEISISQDDVIHCGPTVCVITLQRRDRVISCGERPC